MQCDCESSHCRYVHDAGGCTNPPKYKVTIFGMKMNCCHYCLTVARANFAKDIQEVKEL